MMTYPPIRLLDGPLMAYRERRKAVAERMAKDLLRFESYLTEQDAIRSLYGAGYPMADIVMLVDDARQLAVQEIVAMEMSRP
jgi:hypothetical protein